jgi:osmotically-inducible protein OsmY
MAAVLHVEDGSSGESVSRSMTMTSIVDVQPRAQMALANSPIHELRDLQVEHCQGILVISGAVSSFYHKQLAQEAVRSLCSSIEVINRIRVR